jgi:VanZ family protein
MKKIIGKIIAWLSHWSKDKVLHFSLCLVTALLAGCVAKVIGAEKTCVIASAWFAGFLVGVAKEVWDETDMDGSDVKDWAADITGATIGTLIVVILIV